MKRVDSVFFKVEKLRARTNELKELRYKEIKQIDNWLMREDFTKEERFPNSVITNYQEFPKESYWEGRDRYLWLHTSCEIPETDKRILLLLDFGKTGSGYNSGFESLLFINGEPYQGVDSNHQEVFIDPKYYGQTITLDLKLWSGLEGGGPQQIQRNQFKRADRVVLDESSDKLFYTADAILKTLNELSETTSTYYELLNILNQAFLLINWSEQGSSEFYKSTELAEENLTFNLKQLDRNESVTITALGHTHIDVAWLWRLKHTREKAARSFATVIQLMKQYPEYVFLQTQPQIYQYIKEDYPEMYGEIKELVKQGRWEIDGAMWLEADCNIPSGESLTRQILHGTKFVEREFGKKMTYLWLPDVFGYSWALPQILQKTGIKTFMTTKISWNQYNRMPNDTFKWRGIDGTEILTHFITTPEIDYDDHSEWHYTYNGHMEPETVLGMYQGYRDKQFNSNLLLAYGYGDGGGGVNRDMLEKRRILDQIPTLPNVKTGRADEYFEELHENVEETSEYVHTWDGELYLEYHRGTYTSQAYVKKMNRRIELWLRELEILYSSTYLLSDTTYPKDQLNNVWEILLRNQFHDIIPGSSIQEVYEDHRLEMAQVELEIEQLYSDLINVVEDEWSITNTQGWTRTEWVKVDKADKGYFVNAKGEVLTAIKLEEGYQVKIPLIQPFSTYQIKFITGEMDEKLETTSKNVILDNGLETPHYVIHWNDVGQLTSIFDKDNMREVIEEGGLGNCIELFEDKPMKYNAWDIDIYYQEKSTRLQAKKIEIEQSNDQFTCVKFSYEFGESKLIQRMKVYTDSRRIDFVTNANWQEREQLLKAGFDVDIRSTEATYDIQYGNVKRPTHWNTSWDMAKFETVAHQWVDLSETGYGVGLLNDSKYGHDIKDKKMRITLLKGGINPDPNADIGEHEFIYSLLPHKGDFIEGQVEEEAWGLNQPLTILSGHHEESELFTIGDGEPLHVDVIKIAEDDNGIVLRVHDHTGGRRNISLTPNFSYNQWWETNLLEEQKSERNTSSDIEFELKPYEIKTIRIQ